MFSGDVSGLKGKVEEILREDQNGYIISNVDFYENTFRLLVEEFDSGDFTINDLSKKLSTDSPRYIFLRYFVDHENRGWGDFYNIVIRYIPDRCRIKEKMIYASSTGVIRRHFDQFRVVDMNQDDIFEKGDQVLRDLVLIRQSTNLIRKEDYVEIDENEQDKLDHIKKYSDLEIFLKDETIFFWKSFLCHSNISSQLHKISEYNELSSKNFQVDEIWLLCFITNRQAEIRKIKNGKVLFDYFSFFRHFGMKNEMLRVLNQLGSSTLSYHELFDLFQSTNVPSFSNTVMTKNHKKDLLNSFPTAFSLKLFVLMSLLCIDETKFEEIEYSEFVRFMKRDFLDIRSYKSQDEFIRTSHPDLKDLEDFSILKCLYENRLGNNSLCNLSLKTCDGKVIRVHREILVWRSNFFHLMLNFRGRERQEMEESGRISLLDLTEKETNQLLSFYYLSETNISECDQTTDLEVTLLRCINHADKFVEKNMVKYFENCVLSALKARFGNDFESVKKVVKQEVQNEEIQNVILEQWKKKK